MEDLIEIIKIFSDETRIRIFNLLYEKECCICDIENILNLKQPNISKHIKKMLLLKLIKKRKEGNWSYYSINFEKINEYKFINEIILKLREKNFLNGDIESLKKQKNICKG
ncbi:ArsR family transcriptional regulator [Oceanotoga teriensis]|jgi:ArsR family transcriptional regulator|uniref:ArsR family transcriptional regulator n=1 Tax=Oceanotoga teriensis TaxID=515440 RepID=A0AA45C6G5_9BACT|nr:metalloregulator ArsR/SmtB family transcription factor [Oceanotoga teriensis]PWJ92070.1 ArsR family transcriptional regulator [Oceanotoga teriensis]